MFSHALQEAQRAVGTTDHVTPAPSAEPAADVAILPSDEEHVADPATHTVAHDWDPDHAEVLFSHHKQEAQEELDELIRAHEARQLALARAAARAQIRAGVPEVVYNPPRRPRRGPARHAARGVGAAVAEWLGEAEGERKSAGGGINGILAGWLDGLGAKGVGVGVGVGGQAGVMGQGESGG